MSQRFGRDFNVRVSKMLGKYMVIRRVASGYTTVVIAAIRMNHNLRGSFHSDASECPLNDFAFVTTHCYVTFSLAYKGIQMHFWGAWKDGDNVLLFFFTSS